MTPESYVPENALQATKGPCFYDQPDDTKRTSLLDRLRRILVENFGNNQSAMARQCDIEAETVNRWFNANVPPRAESLVKVADGASVSLDWLVVEIGGKERRALSARDALFDAVRDCVAATLRHEDEATSRRAKRLDRVLAHTGPDAFWDAVIDGFEELPEISGAIEYDEWRDPNYPP